MSDEDFVAGALNVLPPELVRAAALAVYLSCGDRPDIAVICQVAELCDVYVPLLATMFGYGLPLGKSIRTDRPGGYVDLLVHGAVARGPQSRDAWICHAVFLTDKDAPADVH